MSVQNISNNQPNNIVPPTQQPATNTPVAQIAQKSLKRSQAMLTTETEEKPKLHTIRIMTKQGSGVGFVYLEGHNVQNLTKNKIINIQNYKTKEMFAFNIDQLVDQLSANCEEQYRLTGESPEKKLSDLKERFREGLTELQQNGPLSDIDVSELYLETFFPTPSITLQIKNSPETVLTTAKIRRHSLSQTTDDRIISIQNSTTKKIIKFDIDKLALELSDNYFSAVPQEKNLGAIESLFRTYVLQLKKENIVINADGEETKTPIPDKDIEALFNFVIHKFSSINKTS